MDKGEGSHLLQICALSILSICPALTTRVSRVGRSVKGHFQKSSNPQPVLRWRHSTDSGTVFGMTLALNIIKEFHVMCHFYVPKIKKMHF